MVNVRGGKNTKTASEASIPVGCVRRIEFVTLYTSHTSTQVIERLDRFVPFSNPGDTGLFDNILHGARQLYLVLNLRWNENRHTRKLARNDPGTPNIDCDTEVNQSKYHE